MDDMHAERQKGRKAKKEKGRKGKSQKGGREKGRFVILCLYFSQRTMRPHATFSFFIFLSIFSFFYSPRSFLLVAPSPSLLPAFALNHLESVKFYQRTDQPTYGQTDKASYSDGRMLNYIFMKHCSLQSESENIVILSKWTKALKTHGPTDRRRDKAFYKDARTHLKTKYT